MTRGSRFTSVDSGGCPTAPKERFQLVGGPAPPVLLTSGFWRLRGIGVRGAEAVARVGGGAELELDAPRRRFDLSRAAGEGDSVGRPAPRLHLGGGDLVFGRLGW